MLLGNMQDVKHTTTLWKIKSEAVAGGDDHKNDYIDICCKYAKEEGKDDQYIRSVTLPLEIVLFLDDEILILHAIAKRNSLPFGYLDATGKCVRSVQGVAKRTIYYYVLSVNVNHKILLITEFISADQRQSTISSWLLTSKFSWLQEKRKWRLFAIIIVDFSYALINSVLAAFNNWSLKVYIQATYKIVTEGAISANLSIVHVHICCSHFIKVVTKDTALAVADRKLRFKINKLFAALPDSTSKIYIQNTAVIYPQMSGSCTATGVLQM
jgi:hypothetical protein